MNKNVALYARVSSEAQVQKNTISSQIAALLDKMKADGFDCGDELQFIDNGYSGATLIRPALENLRDMAATGAIDKIYIHSPDRLARKYAYQVLLIDEFQKIGVDIVFLNHQIDESPEANLLLQVQGMIAEYERAKIMERNRRGKLHAAQRGSVNVLSGAPYGFEYVDKHTACGQAYYNIKVDEAEVVKTIFNWISKDRLSIGEVCRQLKSKKISSPKGKDYWDRSVIWGMLKNPAYKGEAAFGKTKAIPLRPRLRPQKHSHEQPKNAYSVETVPKNKWIVIAVPAIVDVDIYEEVQKQLEENRKRARIRKRGAKYLLQGLLVCGHCAYSYYGKPVRNKRGDKIDTYAYYRCIGMDAYRFGGKRICTNKQLRTDTLETAVWAETTELLKNPTRLQLEYQRRLSQMQQTPEKNEIAIIQKQMKNIKCGIGRLIDGYTNGYIEKYEFEPRISQMKSRLEDLKIQEIKCTENELIFSDINQVIGKLEEFSKVIQEGLNNVDWSTKREIMRTLIKRVEIHKDNVNVVFKLTDIPDGSVQNLNSLQHCPGSSFAITIKRDAS